MRDTIRRFEASIRQAVVGQQAVVRQILIALLADGHVLLESLPGVAKTRTVEAISARLAVTMKRIQFTPDLLPSDIAGARAVLSGNGSGAGEKPAPGGVRLRINRLQRMLMPVLWVSLVIAAARRVFVEAPVTRDMPARDRIFDHRLKGTRP